MPSDTNFEVDPPAADEEGHTLQPTLVQHIKAKKHVRLRAGVDELFHVYYVLESDGTISQLNDIGGAVVRFTAEGVYTHIENQGRTYNGNGMALFET